MDGYGPEWRRRIGGMEKWMDDYTITAADYLIWHSEGVRIWNWDGTHG